MRNCFIQFKQKYSIDSHVDYWCSHRDIMRKKNKNKDFNFFSKEEIMSLILLLLLLNGMLAVSSRVNEFSNDFTVAMMYSFTNFSSKRFEKFFAIKFEILYDTVRKTLFLKV